MKKTAILLIVATLSLACLAGCAADAAPAQPYSDDPPVYRTNEVVSFKDFCDVALIDTAEGYDSVYKEHYLAYKFWFKNLSSRNMTINCIWFDAYLNNLMPDSGRVREYGTNKWHHFSKQRSVRMGGSLRSGRHSLGRCRN